MLTDRKILKLIILLLSLLTLAGGTHAGDNRPYSCGPALSSPMASTAAQCVPFQKVSPTPGVGQSSVAHRGCASDNLVPVSYVEPGPIRAIAFYAVGLIKSTITAPFRLVETLIPVGNGNDCRPVMPSCSPQLGRRPMPSSPPPCGPGLPPHVVKEYEFPPLESDNILSGLWNLPTTLLRQGRLSGDLFRNDHNVPAPCAR